jgi:hypothetical protein
MDSHLLDRIDAALSVKNEIDNLLILAEYYLDDFENITHKRCQEISKILKLAKIMLEEQSSEFVDLFIMDQTQILQKKTQICVCKKNFQKQAKLIKKMFNQEMFICPVRDYTNSRQVLSQL